MGIPGDKQQRAEQARAAVRVLLPAFAARAAETERGRAVPAANIEALRRVGFYRLVQPEAHGGLELDFPILLELIMDISGACASTGWVCGLLSAHQWLVALFPEAAQRDVWGSTGETVLCGSYAPINEAVDAGGAWRLSGRWSYASGCDSADWSICAARLPDVDGRPGGPAFLLVPAGDWTVDDDWHVNGLAGTGSKTLVLTDVAVPRHRVISFADAAAGRTPGGLAHANRLYSVPVYCQVSACLAATAVGAAAGAVESFVEATGNRQTRGSVTGGNNRMAAFATIQLRVAEAAAAVDAARTILLRDIETVAREVRETGEASVAQRILNRRGQAFAVQLAVRAVELLNAANGGAGLDLANPVQRAWLDVNAVGRHVSLNWDAVGTMAGQQALGLEPRGQY